MLREQLARTLARLVVEEHEGDGLPRERAQASEEQQAGLGYPSECGRGDGGELVEHGEAEAHHVDPKVVRDEKHHGPPKLRLP